MNWSKIDDEKVTALIEVQITPERGRGFEGIAERIYLYPQVKSVYLMSGAYDLLVEVEGGNLPVKSLILCRETVSDRLCTFQPKRILFLKNISRTGLSLKTIRKTTVPHDLAVVKEDVS